MKFHIERKIPYILQYTLPVKFLEALIYPLFSILIVSYVKSTFWLGIFWAYYTLMTILLSFYLKTVEKELKDALIKSGILLFLVSILLSLKIMILLPLIAIIFIYAILYHYLTAYEELKNKKNLTMFEMCVNFSWLLANIVGFFVLSKINIDFFLELLICITFIYFLYAVVWVKGEGIIVFVKETVERAEKTEEKIIEYFLEFPKIVHDHKPKLHPNISLKFSKDIGHFLLSSMLFTFASSMILVNMTFLIINVLGKQFIYIIYAISNICAIIMFYLLQKIMSKRLYYSAIILRFLHPIFLLLFYLNPLLMAIMYRIFGPITWSIFYMYQNLSLVNIKKEKEVASLTGFRNLGTILGNFFGGLLFSYSVYLLLILYYILFTCVILLEKGIVLRFNKFKSDKYEV